MRAFQASITAFASSRADVSSVRLARAARSRATFSSNSSLRLFEPIGNDLRLAAKPVVSLFISPTENERFHLSGGNDLIAQQIKFCKAPLNILCNDTLVVEFDIWCAAEKAFH